LAAQALGIVNGIGDGSFDPDGSIIRSAAARMLALTIAALDFDIYEAPQTAYDDQYQIFSWGRGPINFVSYIGVMGNTSSEEGINTFSPNNVYTIEQSIVTFERMMVWLNLQRAPI
jgi:hypothetical protein